MREALEAQREYGDTWNLVGTLAEASWLEISALEYANAEALLRTGVEKCLEIDDAWQLRESLLMLGVVRLRQGRRDEARELQAATGWDATEPAYIHRRVNSIQRIASRELRFLADKADLENAAQRGRELGVFGAAHRFLQWPASQKPAGGPGS
jgi:hypothetical protein